jgi:hypothetical protein
MKHYFKEDDYENKASPIGSCPDAYRGVFSCMRCPQRNHRAKHNRSESGASGSSAMPSNMIRRYFIALMLNYELGIMNEGTRLPNS